MGSSAKLLLKLAHLWDTPRHTCQCSFLLLRRHLGISTSPATLRCRCAMFLHECLIFPHLRSGMRRRGAVKGRRQTAFARYGRRDRQVAEDAQCGPNRASKGICHGAGCRETDARRSYALRRRNRAARKPKRNYRVEPVEHGKSRPRWGFHHSSLRHLSGPEYVGRAPSLLNICLVSARPEFSMAPLEGVEALPNRIELLIEEEHQLHAFRRSRSHVPQHCGTECHK
mmetsp:Transcript_59376/g.122855  ORF Transcript_59376/g.122855 Transcript_59376/m.122855 type:complete len:227 (-) Transcript_59376:593-1273(-)